MRLNIYSKLLVCFLLIVSLTVAIGISVYYELQVIQSAMAETAASIEVSESLSKLKSVILQFNDIAMEYALGDVYEPKELSSAYAGQEAALATALNQVLTLMKNTPGGQETARVFEASFVTYRTAARAMLSARDELNTSQAAMASGAVTIAQIDTKKQAVSNGMRVFDTAHENVVTAVERASQAQAERATSHVVHQGEALNTATYVIVGVNAAAILIGLVLAYLLARSIAHPLVVIAQGAHKLAQGDLDVELGAKSEDEIGQMAGAFANIVEYTRRIASTSTQMAQGDLTANVTPHSEKDVLGNAFAQMLFNLRVFVAQVQENARGVATASQQLSAGAEQANQATQQVTEAIHQVANGTAEQTHEINQASTQVEQVIRAVEGIAKGAHEQSLAVEKVSFSVTRISQAIQQVSTNAQSSAVASQQAARTAQVGAETITQAVEAVLAIKKTVTEVGRKVQQMSDHSAQIGAIVETINDIATQTNLLALNAAIEAARAGEQGRGFAVVADEVRKLAERAGQATSEITDLVNMVRRGTQEAVAAMQTSLKQVESGSTLAGQAGQALEEILNAVGQVSAQVQHIAQAAQEMSTASTGLVAAMDSVSAIVEENTASTEQISASSAEISDAIDNLARASRKNTHATEQVSVMTEELNAQAKEVTNSAQSLAGMAEQLRIAVARFKLADFEPRGSKFPPQVLSALPKARDRRSLNSPQLGA